MQSNHLEKKEYNPSSFNEDAARQTKECQRDALNTVTIRHGEISSNRELYWLFVFVMIRWSEILLIDKNRGSNVVRRITYNGIK
eukprot:CCRYP_010035-RE/>CCRYP_010035-RE protein AED:0.31 eAED:0.31 QI:1866/0.5/0.66/1/0.5/0.33/3/0/83